MDVHSPDALFQALRDSGLYDPAQLAVLDALTPEQTADMPALSAALKAAGLLTAYQARKVRINRIVELLVGPYLVLDKIGEGGMGKVYKAVQRRVGRVVALKVVRPHLMSNKTVMKRYRREVAAASKLTHPNIVSVFDADEFNGKHYLAMEFVNGSDLARLVKEFGPLPYPEACEYVRQSALGLQHAHDCGFVHRDIKPSNLLVSGERAIPGTGGEANVKILDMGLVRSLADDDADKTELTRDGTVVGTPDYMAPEQAKNSSTVDQRADLYSLGGTLFYLLTARPPFPDGTPIDKLLRHQLDAPPDLKELRPDCPAGVAEIVSRLLAKSPADRIPTAGEVAARLIGYTTDTLNEPLMAEVVSSPDVPARSDSPVPDGSTEVSVPAVAKPARAAVKVKAARPVGIPRPRETSDTGADGASTTDDSGLTLRRRRRRRRGVGVWVWLAVGVGLAAITATAVLLPRPDGPTKPEGSGPVASGKGPPVVPSGTGPSKPPDPPPPAGLPPAGWLLPDRTAAVLVVHPAGYWRVVNERNLVRPDSRLAGTLNRLAGKYLLDLRTAERLTVADAPAGPVVVAEGPATAAADRPAKVKAAAGGEMKAGPHTLAVFAAPGKPAVYAGFPTAPGHPTGYALGSDNKLVAEVCKRAAGRKPSALVPNTLLSALPESDDPSALLTFAAGPDWKLPGKGGGTLASYGVTLMVAKVRLGPDRFNAELVVYARDRDALRDFVSLGLAKRLGDDFPGAGNFLTNLTDLQAAEWTDGGSQPRLKATAHWPLADAHEWAEELLPAGG